VVARGVSQLGSRCGSVLVDDSAKQILASGSTPDRPDNAKITSDGDERERAMRPLGV
jgi:hypothetical protein